PDKEIGRSNLFTAKNAGDWSSWIFKSVYDKIFVGNTWKQSDDRIYYQIDGKLEGYKGLSNKLFYSREFNGKPTQSVGPRFTNIKVSFKDIENDGFGVTEQEISNIENAGHQVQLWQILPEFTKKAEYEISIKHAAEGEKGSFYIIAWADTNNDGIPDKEIGRSNLFTAKNAGDWSSWAFKSEYDKIFVGNTWKQSDDRIYYQSGGNLKGYKGLSNKLFYSREFNGKPTQSTSPRYTNVKIKILK
ncbi:MAG: hypothetical protein JXA16_13755, partial [Bacteroidales bacterium]|nr:hypothetical protein [Bacteroidales bacterium]